MKSLSSIPTSKVARATQFIKTGVKIGGNYLKHEVKKIGNPNLSKEELHNDNATDIYESLSQLKGSALKVAQMLSMDKNVMPRAYIDRFQMSQYSAPPLSGPLVVKTFKSYFDKTPAEIFDSFEMVAINAASIGQVHLAYKNGQKLAVKIQYPGVADSISSDLKMVKPMAIALFGLNQKDIDRYMGEVEGKLLEETDYNLELRRSEEISKACAHLQNIFFPKYLAEFSAKRILTMDWLEGLHLKEFMLTNPSQEVRNKIGQALWDFYDYQFHTLRKVHADPHPGNFLMRADGTIGVIDFGCVKEIPNDYYDDYFDLINPDTIQNKERTLEIFHNLEFLLEKDSESDRLIFIGLFHKMVELLGRPFRSKSFDFGDQSYFDEVYAFAEELTKVEALKRSNVARGSQHGLYVNRTYFGLYSILSDLKAEVVTHKPLWLHSAKEKEEISL
jgi:predicted unusual protein kinase regulating ubiquinone biosynthesis (AarF/ABC1/UbiB family)